MNFSSPSYRIPSAARSLPALAAVAIVGTVVIAGVAGGFGGDGGDARPTPTTAVATSSSTSTVPATQPIAVDTSEVVATTHLAQPYGLGMAGPEVERLQQRLDELGFFVGPIDGAFGALTEKAVWAYQKIVMGVPRDEVRSIVTDEMWQDMQRPMRIEPRRKFSEGEATRSHTEVYLPEQVLAFFVDDEPVLISHMSSGSGEEWAEVVQIDPGEFGNENGTEVLERRELGVSVTPGGVFKYERMVEGLRNSALGGMWDPAYFNYGIAIHGALNVPLDPASHGCIRVPQSVGVVFHDYISLGDQVFVWDGIKEPEHYAQNPNRGYPQGQLPIFNRVDPTYTTTTTSTTTTEVATTVAPTQATTPTTPRPTTPATQAPTTPPPTPPATTTTLAPPPPTDPPATGG